MDNTELQIYGFKSQINDNRLQHYYTNEDSKIAKNAAYVIGTLHDEVVNGVVRESELTAIRSQLANKNMKLKIMELEKESIKKYGSKYDPSSDCNIKNIKLESKKKKYENKLSKIEIQISSLESRKQDYINAIKSINNGENIEDSDDE